MNPVTAEEIVGDSIELFSLPDIYFQVSEMIHDPRFSVSDIGTVISKDPGLSARLLKLVNSPIYTFQSRVDTISRAVVVVGIEDLKNLILATAVVDTFKEIPSELVDMTTFWMRSVHCGVVCKLLAKASSVLHSERLFLTGLLHDIGSLVLYCKYPEESMRVLMATEGERTKVAALEQEIIGVNHAGVGSELIKRWGLPESLYEAIACYPAPQLAQVHRLDAYLLSFAAQLVNAAEQGGSPAEMAQGLDKTGLKILRLSPQQIIDEAERASEEFTQVFDLMAPGKRFH